MLDKLIELKRCKNVESRFKINDGFLKDVLTLTTGTVVAQAIPIAVAPVLTRLYTPKDFGVLAIFIALTNVLGMIANARYELAIVLPKEEKEAVTLTAFSMILAAVIALVLFIFIVVFHDWITFKLGTRGISVWLYFVPLVVFLIGIFNALKYLHVRMKEYGVVAKASVWNSLGGAIPQVLLGVMKFGALGLIVSQIISSIIGPVKFILSCLNKKLSFRGIAYSDLKTIALKYKNFPKFSSWGILAAELSKNVISIAIPVIFNTTILGLYSLVNRILSFPMILIGSSISDVFLKRASEERNSKGNAVEIFKTTLFKLLIISVLIFPILFFVCEDLFAFVFGEEWRVSGQYAKILIILFAARFIVATLSNAVNVFEKQKIGMFWQLSLLGFTILSIVVTVFYNLDIKGFLGALTGFLSFAYLSFLIVIWKICKGEKDFLKSTDNFSKDS